MGAFQLLHMDRIPAHAAINESVELCRAAEQPHAAGMVNAILRGITREADPAKQRGPEAAKRSTPIFESPAAIAERLGHPAWLVERWVTNYGRAAALAICEYGQRETGAGGLFPADAGERLQIDDGSRLVAELAAAAMDSAMDLSKGGAGRVWDCCAAPGGKTLVMAERLPDAQILATDVSAKRLERMKRRVAATGSAARIRCGVMDAAKADFAAKSDLQVEGGALPLSSFDLILCDVPCSGTGTLARNPEIRHRLRPEELTRQAERQVAILRGALSRLATGGRLLYSTCSLEPEENEQVVEAVLRESAHVRKIPVGPLFKELAAAGVLDTKAAAGLAETAVRNGCLRTLPGVHPWDGFFAALFERMA
jgi:16S rRNA (cytosine967-C5)-methyltransferase